MTAIGEFEEYINSHLPAANASAFDVMFDVKPKNRRLTKSVRTPMDPDMFQAIQDLLMNKQLPFAGDIGAMGRHVWASGIESLKDYLTSDARTVWSALQSIQRRLTAERYVVTIEDQVKEAAEMMAAWTLAQEWGAVASDLEFVVQQLEDFPSPAWKRRVAREWMTNGTIQQLFKIWEEDMAGSPAEWGRVERAWKTFQRLTEG